MEEDWTTFTTFQSDCIGERPMEPPSTESSPNTAASPLQQLIDWEGPALAQAHQDLPTLTPYTLNPVFLLPQTQGQPPEPFSKILTFCQTHNIKTQDHPTHTLLLKGPHLLQFLLKNQIPKTTNPTYHNTISPATLRFIKERGIAYGEKGWVSWKKTREYVWGINSDVYRNQEADWEVVDEFLRVFGEEVEMAERAEPVEG
ncbi:hypothetical protein HK097_008068 [Rhizophlyctis rosea]|uniref:Uncharacterized protein n=1 Tax=Rhizophlyctis rosea TaxID=64517 RepID=A0AAD5SAU3_9FUNG|nr:hypothetical protein HK097_008068 [Rhizophlyctis rosea]